MTIEPLRSLRDRAAAATGADRELDARLSFFFDPKKGISYGYVDDFGWAPQDTVAGWDDAKWANAAKSLCLSTPRYTASLDASVALVERMLPGWGYQITRTERGEHHHSILSRSHPTNLIVHGQKTGKGCAALALICAMLDALIEQAEGKA